MACMLSAVAKNKAKVDDANLVGLEMRIFIGYMHSFLPSSLLKDQLFGGGVLELQGSIDDIL